MPSLQWHRWEGLRVRLAVCYTLLLGLTMLVIGGYLHFRLQRSLLEQVDGDLQIAAAQALHNVDRESNSLIFDDAEESGVMASRLSRAGLALRLIALDGTVLGSFGSSLTVPSRVPIAPGHATLIQNQTKWRVYSQQIQPYRSRPGGWLQVAQSLRHVEEASASLLGQMLLGLPLVLLLAALGGLLLADQALRPVDRISRTAQAISAGDLTWRIGSRGVADEVGRLAATFDQMLDRLQAAFERERRFTADASHELRTPLTVIKGRLSVTLSRRRTPPEYENTLRDLEQEVDRLIRLSTDLLLLTRLDQGSRDLQPERLDLSDLLGAVVEQVQPLAEIRSIAIIKDIPPELSIYGDPDHLIRLFLNLLDNAIKYTPIKGQVKVLSARQGAAVWVAISDTGSGIAPEHLPHLFERFYRVEANRSRHTGGAGLGLAISYEIVRLHQGSLNVQSEPGQGTTFTVHLPNQPQV